MDWHIKRAYGTVENLVNPLIYGRLEVNFGGPVDDAHLLTDPHASVVTYSNARFVDAPARRIRA